MPVPQNVPSRSSRSGFAIDSVPDAVNCPDDDTVNNEASGKEYPKALNAALHFLTYRPRSESEVRRRLSRRYLPDVIERVILFLRQNRYLDDAAFAQLWRRSREQSRPKGRRAVEYELRQFRVDREVIEEALEGFDDRANAYKVAQKPAARLAAKDSSREVFRRKIGALLQRRGFGYSVVAETVDRLWQESAGD